MLITQTNTVTTVHCNVEFSSVSLQCEKDFNECFIFNTQLHFAATTSALLSACFENAGL